jgi:hypothetical protein
MTARQVMTDRLMTVRQSADPRRPSPCCPQAFLVESTSRPMDGDGDRVEIYRPPTVDPQTVKQRAKPDSSDPA